MAGGQVEGDTLRCTGEKTTEIISHVLGWKPEPEWTVVIKLRPSERLQPRTPRDDLFIHIQGYIQPFRSRAQAMRCLNKSV